MIDPTLKEKPKQRDSMFMLGTCAVSVSRGIPSWTLHIAHTDGCVVYLGNAVVNQVHDDATCRDKGSSRATVDVAKVPDLYGFVSVFAIEIAHGKQAFVQVEIGVGGYTDMDMSTS